MTNNDILRRFRYALDISNPAMIEIFRLSGHAIEPPALIDLLRKEDDPGFVECGDTLLDLFLDGLIVQKRGPREPAPGQQIAAHTLLTNNIILRKLRIALELKEDDMIALMRLAGVVISKSELSALFRNQGQKNYKECGDQFLRNFLKGLTLRHRGSAEPPL